MINVLPLTRDRAKTWTLISLTQRLCSIPQVMTSNHVKWNYFSSRICKGRRSTSVESSPNNYHQRKHSQLEKTDSWKTRAALVKSTTTQMPGSLFAFLIPYTALMGFSWFWMCPKRRINPWQPPKKENSVSHELLWLCHWLSPFVEMF
jgi:hypothetical protein